MGCRHGSYYKSEGNRFKDCFVSNDVRVADAWRETLSVKHEDRPLTVSIWNIKLISLLFLPKYCKYSPFTDVYLGKNGRQFLKSPAHKNPIRIYIKLFSPTVSSIF